MRELFEHIMAPKELYILEYHKNDFYNTFSGVFAFYICALEYDKIVK